MVMIQIKACYPKKKFYRTNVIKLLFVVSNFYNRYKTSIIIKSPKNAEEGRGVPPTPLKTSACKFLSAKK